LLAALIIFGGIKFLISNDTVHAVLYLFLVLMSMAGIFFSLNAPFVAAMQILVYAGAITVLILFVVMLTGGRIPEIKKLRPNSIAVIIMGALMYFIILLASTSFKPEAGVKEIANVKNVEAIGTFLFKDYVYPFEIASILLLVAIIGAIYLVSEIKFHNDEGSA
jgi:NADH:ubiquinone oxidoreductase subunit 6 (subunit J)